MSEHRGGATERLRPCKTKRDFSVTSEPAGAGEVTPGGRFVQLAVHVEDHPAEYLDFEGVIPKGEYGGGDVIVWDWGTWEPVRAPDAAQAIEAGELHFDLRGEKLSGRFLLVRRDKERSARSSGCSCTRTTTTPSLVGTPRTIPDRSRRDGRTTRSRRRPRRSGAATFPPGRPRFVSTAGHACRRRHRRR